MTKNSSNSSKGEGNTKPPPKQISPAKRWCFTCFSLTEENLKNIIDVTKSSNSSSIIGLETCPDSKKKHWQCYIEFDEKCRPKNLFKDKTIHWEKAKGNKKQNIKYCSKENNILFCNFKIPKPLKKLECEDNFYEWQEDIKKLLEKEPNDRDINWIWSMEGCAGKTTFGKWIYRNYDNVIINGGKSADMKNCIVDFVNKNDGMYPEIIIMNIPRSFNNDYLSYTGIEECKDMFFYSGKYEGGMIDGNPPHLIVFANEPPDMNKMSEDRWKVTEVLKMN